MTAFDTKESEVDDFVKALAEASEPDSGPGRQ
jgi:hypothetical protein